MKRSKKHSPIVCVMQIGYTTTAGSVIIAGETHQGTQGHPGGPVEITLSATGERVCFSARECGLPVPACVIEDLTAAA